MDIAVTIVIIAAVVIIAIAAVWVVSSGKSRDLVRRLQLEIEEKNSELEFSQGLARGLERGAWPAGPGPCQSRGSRKVCGKAS